MRNSALVLTSLIAATAVQASLPAAAATYERLTATVKSIDAAGRIHLGDNSTIILDKTVKVDGEAAPGSQVTVTYSADENGYVFQTANFVGAASGSARN
ncbi:MAG: hypothetical protein APF80_11100 [Alphaproteobacteria bacterium BRH_c36]|nr:MAG: hypothetical protein APF80_11100 [Alphaproteobacteria bacterium BRH_c36]